MITIIMPIASHTRPDNSLPHIPHSEIESYLSLIANRCNVSIASNQGVAARQATPADVFELLIKRKYCYLSKSKAGRYKKNIVELLEPRMSAAQTIPFFYDIGGGYHASIRLGEDELVFHAGLAEFFILSQVASFCRDVRQLYAPGARFFLVVDNLCAALVNDIPISKTLDFCSSLRGIINELGLSDAIGLLVESESFTLEEYGSRLHDVTSSNSSLGIDPSAQDIENVSRFLGRPCSKEEAMQRIQRYRDVIEVSENALNSIIDGVHMTQRASDSTFGFRPFPGGDSRVQAGQVALKRNSKGNLCPFLLTSTNTTEYTCETIAAPGALPTGIDHITYAEKVGY